jgi:hypothetical protein
MERRHPACVMVQELPVRASLFFTRRDRRRGGKELANVNTDKEHRLTFFTSVFISVHLWPFLKLAVLAV